jgi:hypothetical protein
MILPGLAQETRHKHLAALNCGLQRGAISQPIFVPQTEVRSAAQ